MEALNFVFAIDRTTLVTCCIFILTWILAYIYLRSSPYLPPGPAFMPIVGNLLSLAGGDVLGNLECLRREYGDVYRLYFGHELAIIVNGYEAIHEALVRNGSLFLRRPVSNFHKLAVPHAGIAYANGQKWREQRHFSQEVLQTLCFKDRVSNLETHAKHEIKLMLEKISGIEGPFDIDRIIQISAANVILKIVCNDRADFEDLSFQEYLKDIHDQTYALGKATVLVNCFPFLSFIPFDLLGIRRLNVREKKMKDWLRKFITGRTNVPDTTSNNAAYVDFYQDRINNSKEKEVIDTFTDEQMYHTCNDLLGAGSETTASSVKWALLYLIHNPEIQDKMAAEMEEVIGKDVMPGLDHRPHLPYCNAVILEVLRAACVAPLALPHTVPRDVTFRGHLIPENATVIFNLNSAMKDTSVWADANEFRPERFLDNSSETVICQKEFIPFGLGPRSCLGETIARIELFLFVTSLIQKFKVTVASPDKLPGLEGVLGLTLSPVPFEMNVVKR